MSPNTSPAIRAYQHVRTECALSDCSPHRLIQMLYEAVLDRLAAARGCLERRQFAEKGALIARAIAILAALRGWLDMERGGEIAQNLERLYDYMERRLMQAHAENDPAILDEVAGLLREIKLGWDAIAPGGTRAGGP
jgi:flagellar protein FliS